MCPGGALWRKLCHYRSEDAVAELVAGVQKREEEVAVTTRRNTRPADREDSGSIGGNARADLFDNDLSDLLGKTFGDFHILQNMA
jgi:hypothetical protein